MERTGTELFCESRVLTCSAGSACACECQIYEVGSFAIAQLSFGKISNEVRPPAEFKHILKRRNRN